MSVKPPIKEIVETQNLAAMAELHGQKVEEMKIDLGDEPDSVPAADPSQQNAALGQFSDWLNSNAGQAFLPAKASVAREWISNRRKGLKPWREFFQTDKFKAPAGVPSAGKRLAVNVDQFQSNYFFVFIFLFLYCILTSPSLLLALGACGGLIYTMKAKRDEGGKVKLGGRELNMAAQYALIVAISFPLFWIAGAGSTIFWVIGASIFVILAHAIMYASEPAPGAEFLVESA